MALGRLTFSFFCRHLLNFGMSHLPHDAHSAIRHPLDLTERQLETIRKIARVVMETEKCDYTRAVLVAYIEWLEMADMDETKH